MFMISAELYAIFAQQASDDFRRRAVEHLRQDMSSHVVGLSDEDLRIRIESAIQLAGKYDLVDEQDVICFLDAGLFLNHETFADNPKYRFIQGVLQDKDLDPEQRAEQTLTLAFQQVLMNER